MNFYIGNSIDEIKEQDYNVEFSDELIDFIYKLNQEVSFDMHQLCEINPYTDMEISKNDLMQIIQICKYILDNKLLYDYDEPDEGNQNAERFSGTCPKSIIKKIRTNFYRRLGLSC